MSIPDEENSKLATNDLTLSLQELAGELYFFSQNLTNGSDAPELAMQLVADANLRHRWVNHRNRESLDIQKKQDHNELSLDRAMTDWDVYAVRKSNQLRIIRSSTPSIWSSKNV